MSENTESGRVSIPLQRELESVKEGKYQYFYRHNACRAETACSNDCVCWHNEGTGEFANARHDDKETWENGIPKSWRLR